MNSELLLPVGNMSMALAAIHNGADAIYVGMPGFNARGRTHDHSIEDLKEIIEICHLYNVHVHVAFNILIYQNEIEKAVEILNRVLKLGPDALIVQDLGLVKIINQIAPDQVIHGSTQMTVTNHEAIKLLDDLSIKRFVLGRENSLEDIKAIKSKTNKELEVFVHGALCVAYSGQCFTSEVLGGRSANRGQCAQSCRFEYDLIVDGEVKDLKDIKYLVSPKDLCGLDEIPNLIDLGVESFKVEGRLKSPEYVASVASSYRQAIDKVEDLDVESARNNMAITYSRGMYGGWLNGVAHQELVDGSFASNRGLEIGIVAERFNKKVYIRTKHELFAGDGLFFVLDDQEVGGNIYELNRNHAGYEVKFNKNLDIDCIDKGYRVFLNSREKLYKELRKTFSDKNLFKKIPIDIQVEALFGQPLKIEVIEGDRIVECQTTDLLEKAKTQGISEDSVKTMLNKLSHSVYTINKVESNIEDQLFINNKALKNLKQDMVAKLNEVRVENKHHVDLLDFTPEQQITSEKSSSKLNILIRKIEQLNNLVDYLVDNPIYKRLISSITLDYEFGKDFVKSIKILKHHDLFSVIATTRILKPNEYHNFTLIERANPDGILIRNLGALNYFTDRDFLLYGDFSLNVTNSYTFNYLVSKGLKSICLSYDMDKKQVSDILSYVDSSKVEITAHQYMPEFHMEHCVFAAFLSDGNSFKDCGKPCEKHRVQLKDMYGNMHEIKADQECRNTMYSSGSMSAAMLIPDWQDAGVTLFRFEALHEEGDEFLEKIDTYLKLINNEFTSDEVYLKIGKLETYGVNSGQLLNTRKYKAKKKDVRP